MQFGCCGSLEQAPAMADAGFDFIEGNVQALLQGDTDDAAYTPPEVASLPLPLEACNCLLPGHHLVVGPDRDDAALATYLQRVARRAGEAGITRLVFGSGRSRRRPDDVSSSRADEQLVSFCRLAGDACGEHGVLLVVEHLNRGETNTITSAREERELIEAVDHPAVAALLDSYHLALEGEGDEAVLELAPHLRHVHVAEPEGRREPGAIRGDAAYDYEHLFALLRKAGYDERISVEAKWSRPLEEGGAGVVNLLREAWQRSGDAAGVEGRAGAGSKA